MIKYFHELTREEIAAIPKDMTFGQVAKDYPQPVWCKYPDATFPDLGCFGLVCGYVRDEGKAYCAECECSKEVTK